ncbi:MAG: hypothetical protein DHS20C02_08840 [Micavibrio sp.]|nr:MAG: hypothetical protein DHS20C02_08840 [Micavibrio sp.]
MADNDSDTAVEELRGLDQLEREAMGQAMVANSLGIAVIPALPESRVSEPQRDRIQETYLHLASIPSAPKENPFGDGSMRSGEIANNALWETLAGASNNRGGLAGLTTTGGKTPEEEKKEKERQKIANVVALSQAQKNYDQACQAHQQAQTNYNSAVARATAASANFDQTSKELEVAQSEFDALRSQHAEITLMHQDTGNGGEIVTYQKFEDENGNYVLDEDTNEKIYYETDERIDWAKTAELRAQADDGSKLAARPDFESTLMAGKSNLSESKAKDDTAWEADETAGDEVRTAKGELDKTAEIMLAAEKAAKEEAVAQAQNETKTVQTDGVEVETEAQKHLTLEKIDKSLQDQLKTKAGNNPDGALTLQDIKDFKDDNQGVSDAKISELLDGHTVNASDPALREELAMVLDNSNALEVPYDSIDSDYDLNNLAGNGPSPEQLALEQAKEQADLKLAEQQLEQEQVASKPQEPEGPQQNPNLMPNTII